MSTSSLCVSIDMHLFFVQVFACQKRKTCKTLSNIYADGAYENQGQFNTVLFLAIAKSTQESGSQQLLMVDIFLVAPEQSLPYGRIEI